jgi:hypothetical protein
MMFKEIITFYTDNHTGPINIKYNMTDCYSRWYMQLPFGFKELSIFLVLIYFFSILKPMGVTYSVYSV